MPNFETVAAYKRPPNIETVLEIKFATTANMKVVDHAAAKLKRFYKRAEMEQRVEATMEIKSGLTQHKSEIIGWRMTSDDQTELLLLYAESFVFAQLAPYPGFDVFFQRIKRDYRYLKEEFGFRSVTRLGLRAINRVDIPIKQFPHPQPHQFLTIGPNPPPFGSKTLLNFTMQLENSLDQEGNKGRVTVATIAPIVPGTNAFVLDVDVYRDNDLPDSEAGIWELVLRLRQLKNLVFESTITEETRSLFG